MMGVPIFPKWNRKDTGPKMKQNDSMELWGRSFHKILDLLIGESENLVFHDLWIRQTSRNPYLWIRINQSTFESPMKTGRISTFFSKIETWEFEELGVREMVGTTKQLKLFFGYWWCQNMGFNKFGKGSASWNLSKIFKILNNFGWSWNLRKS